MVLHVVNGFAEIEEEFAPLGSEIADPDFLSRESAAVGEFGVGESPLVGGVDEAVDEEVEVFVGGLEEAFYVLFFGFFGFFGGFGFGYSCGSHFLQARRFKKCWCGLTFGGLW